MRPLHLPSKGESEEGVQAALRPGKASVMRPIAHRASVVVSGLLGAGLLWVALRAPEPTVVEVPQPPAQEEQQPEQAVPPELPKAALAEVVLPAPPAPKAAPKPQAKAEVKPTPAPAKAPQPAPTPEPAPEPKPVAEPAPAPVAETPIAPEPVAETPEIPPPTEEPAPAAAEAPAPAPLKPLKPTVPARQEQPAPPLQVRPLQPSQIAEAREPAPEITPLRPTPLPQAEPRREPVEAPVVPLRPTPPAERAAPPPSPPVAAAARPAPVRAAPAPAPAPAPAVAGPTVEVSLRPDTPAVRDGRALLLILEHGAGPGIEIYWPDDRQQRERLHHNLSACYGMRTALIDGGNRLYVSEGTRGQPWIPNMDRYSGFMRQPQGAMVGQEQREAASIARYHGFAQSLRVVRIFPRSVDAALLGGLRTLIGDRYGSARAIAADYRSTSSGLFVDNIRVDGASVPGRIAFPTVRGGGCA